MRWLLAFSVIMALSIHVAPGGLFRSKVVAVQQASAAQDQPCHLVLDQSGNPVFDDEGQPLFQCSVEDSEE
jgi:hypothetical protein